MTALIACVACMVMVWCGGVRLEQAMVMVIVVVVVMTAGSMVDGMVWYVILYYIIIIIIIRAVWMGLGCVVVTRKLYALYPKNDPFLGHYG